MAVPEKFVNIGLVGFTDKGEYDPESIYMMNDIVHRNNSLWRCQVDNTTGIEPEENHNWTVFIRSSEELGGITATDSKGIMGPEGERVSAQELMEKLSAPEFEDFSQEGATVPEARTAVSKILSGVPIPKIFSKIKAALMGLVTLGEMRAFLVNNGLCTEEGKYFLDAAYGKTLKDAIDSTNSNLDNRMTLNLILPQGNYIKNEEYPLSIDLNKYAYFVGMFNWNFSAVKSRNWYDDEYDSILFQVTYSRTSDHVLIIDLIQLSFSRTRKILKFPSIQSYVFENGTVHYAELSEIWGCAIYGMVSR